MKYKHFLLYVIIVILSIFSEYKYSSNLKYESQQKKIYKFQNEKVLSNYSYYFDQNITYGIFWDMENEELLLKNGQDSSKQQKKFKIKFDSTKDSICINTSCNKLLAVKFIEKEPYVIFYNETLNKKIFSLKKGDLLDDYLRVEDILNTKVVIKEPETDNSWTIKLFDVNQTKYLPKDKNESKIY